MKAFFTLQDVVTVFIAGLVAGICVAGLLFFALVKLP